MIKKSGKLFIDGKLQKNRYDKNENYGSNCGNPPTITFYEIVKELFWGGLKIAVSRKKILRFGKDFTGIAFDPPENKANG